MHSIKIHQPFGKPSSKHNVLMQKKYILFCIITASSESTTWAAKTYFDYWSCKSIPANIFSTLFLVVAKNKEKHWGKCSKNNDSKPCTTKIITIHGRKRNVRANIVLIGFCYYQDAVAKQVLTSGALWILANCPNDFTGYKPRC